VTAIHRREMFRVLLGGAVIGTMGSTLISGAAKSAPLMTDKSLLAPTENLVEEAVVVVRRRRVRRCWWHRGHRVCRWVWR